MKTMKHWFKTLLFSIVLTYTSANLIAQTSRTHAFISGLSLRGMGTFELQYQYSDSLFSRTFRPYVGFEMPVILYARTNSVSTYRIDLGSEYGFFQNRQWLTEIDLSVAVSRQNQLLGRFIPADINIGMTAARRMGHSHLGLFVGLWQNMFTHIRFSDYVKEGYNDLTDIDGDELHISPVDGFYGFTSTQIPIGITGRFFLGQHFDLSTDFGYLYRPVSLISSAEGTKYGWLPAYLNLRLYYFF